MRWSAYYGDGSRYDGITEAHAFAAPVLPGHYGVQIMKQEADNERGFSQRHGCTFYCWETIHVPRWGGHDDLFGLAHYLLTHQGAQKILIGREIYDAAYKDIGRRVVAEGSFDQMDFRPGQLTL